MQPILRGLKLPLPVVEQNGAFVSDLTTGEHLLTRAIDRDVAEEVYGLIRAAGCLPFVSSFDGRSDRLYYSEVENPGMQWYVDDRTSNSDSRLCRTDDVARGLSEQVVCVTVIDDPGVIERLASVVRGRFGPELTTRRFTNEYYRDWDWLTIHDGRAGKDKALAWLLTEFGLGESEVVAFGDSDSDVPLFRFADRGIAVDNALAELRSIATEIIGHSSQDSVIAYLERDWTEARGERATSSECET